MRTQELLPGRPLLPLRSGFDPALSQNVGDGASADVVIQVGKRTLNPGMPHERFSVAIRMTHSRISTVARGRPGPRRKWPSYLRAISARCHASKVSGVTIDLMSVSARRPSVLAFAANRMR